MNQKRANAEMKQVFVSCLTKNQLKKRGEHHRRTLSGDVCSVTRSLGFMLNGNDHLEDEMGRR